MIDTIQTRREQTEAILAEVCAKHGVTREALVSVSHLRKIVHARQEAMHRLYAERTHLSLPQIGELLGGRHHATVLWGIEAHAARLRGERTAHGGSGRRFTAAHDLRRAA